jgi:integrase/recombinase XerD
MPTPAHVHNYAVRVANMVRNLQESPRLSLEIKAAIVRFHDDCFARGISAGRVARYLHEAILLHEWFGKDLATASLPEVRSLVARIEQSDYAPASKRDFKIALRKYVRFAAGTEEYPATVSWIRASQGVKTMRIPEEVLTPEEVTRMVGAAPNARDRALIAVLYESGCRIGEILDLRVQDVTPATPGIVLRVDGKTGPRRIRLIASTPYLVDYLNGHRFRDEPSRHLWVTLNDLPMQYARTALMLRRAARIAGIKKHIYPHLFRHSRATHLASHLTESQMKAYFGWVQASEMAGIYVHMSGRDVDHAILRLNGLEDQRKSTLEVLPPRPCRRCGTSNGATNRFCTSCSGPMTDEAARELSASVAARTEADSVLDVLMDDPEVRELLSRKISALGRRKSA